MGFKVSGLSSSLVVLYFSTRISNVYVLQLYMFQEWISMENHITSCLEPHVRRLSRSAFRVEGWNYHYPYHYPDTGLAAHDNCCCLKTPDGPKSMSTILYFTVHQFCVGTKYQNSLIWHTVHFWEAIILRKGSSYCIPCTDLLRLNLRDKSSSNCTRRDSFNDNFALNEKGKGYLPSFLYWRAASVRIKTEPNQTGRNVTTAFTINLEKKFLVLAAPSWQRKPVILVSEDNSGNF